MNLSIRRATFDDIPAALALCRLSGWNQKPEDWHRLIQYEPSGCFVAESKATIVGTITTTCYGQELAWIGMMLVHPDFRRRGIATALMERSLDYLRHSKQVRCIKLDATPEGRHVYEQLGFVDEWTLQRWRRLGVTTKHSESPTPQQAIAQVNRLSLDRFRQLDRLAFGVDRWDWILRVLPESDVQCGDSAVGMRRAGFLADYLGPVIAESANAARQVVVALVDRTSRDLFWDIPDPNRDAVQLADELQFEPARQLTRMWIGDSLVPSDLTRLFGLVDPSVG